MRRRRRAPSQRSRWADEPWSPYPRYVSVADRRETGARHAADLARRGRAARPVVPRTRGRQLAATFWGRAWCDNLQAYASLANRLVRGRRYLRSGLVIDLSIGPGAVAALVSGTEVYDVAVRIKAMPPARWKAVVKACAGRIDSVVELLAGRFDESVMAHVCKRDTGLFPSPREMTYSCTCPDGSRGGWVCKHVAAALYGVGVRLDESPELLFELRRVAHADLVAGATVGLTRAAQAKPTGRRAIEPDRLSTVFGIDLDAPEVRGARRKRSKEPGSR
jgi:uncharacterized Zn finger protein